MPPPAVAQADPQHALAASELDARPVDAGQVGVPVVRRVGPRLPLRAARARRPGVRQGAALAAALRAVPASQRPDPGVRVGVLRPQPAGARVGRAGASTTWRRRAPATADRAVPREVLPQAADQLRVVGQQGRQRGQQRLRGRLPRARQHHRHRPQREAAGRRDARAVRRDRLDGHVLPEPDADRAGAGEGEPRLRGRWRRSSSSTTSTSAAR